MASRSNNDAQAATSDEIKDLLTELEKRMDRTKVMFEQYFMGIQKVPPGHLHRDLERRVRDLTRVQIRNTALRFRFSTLSQRFGSYNTYWKRTLREIEQGRYIRDIARIGRDAARSGAEIPEEVLAKMPKLMRERIMRDRQQVVERAEREKQQHQEAKSAGLAKGNRPSNVHHINESDLLEDLDMDSIFSSLVGEPETEGKAAAAPAEPPKSTSPSPVVAAIPANPGPSASERPAPSPPKRKAPAARVKAPMPKITPPKSPAARKEKPPPGMSEGQAQSFYQQYVKAKRLVGEPTEKVSYDRVMRSLNKQAPGILKDHKAKGVMFNVEVKGDKVVIKAKPQK